MATITATTSTSLARSCPLPRRVTGVSTAPVLGLPSMVMKGKVKCSMEEKPSSPNTGANLGMTGSLIAAASAMATSNPALALVDERLSTEGTGLSLGLSNNLLGWILLGVFSLIWSLYFVYTSTLEEDEESGLSL